MPQEDYCSMTAATFSKFAERYAEKYFHLDIYDRFLLLFADKVKPRGARVLDVACGPGNISACLTKARPDFRLTGIDLAEDMIKQARLRVPTADFLVKDCRHLEELGQTFDAAAFGFGLSYLTDQDANLFFRSLNAVLSDSSMLYLSTLTGDPAWSGIESSSSGDRVYLHYRKANEVISMVQQAGYRVELTEVIASPPGAPKVTEDLILIAQRITA